MAGIMIQGTASSAGKSLLVTALCRIFSNDGLKVAPFKSQNMSLNSYVTLEGLEMGRAQVLQAQAARIEPSVLMNPILLKPTTNRKSQVIIKGRPYRNMDAAAYFAFKPQLREMIRTIYRELESQHDVVVLEGAGSPAEINLQENDIVNMGMAAMAKAPVLLAADIDKGGVFASIYGTVMLLPEHERAMMKGVVINKFRGDVSLLKAGLDRIEALTGIPVIGVIPYITDLQLDEEDSAIDFNRKSRGAIDICVITLPRISNFTDFDAFRSDEDVTVRYVSDPSEIQGADMVVIPGSKNTIGDLRWLKQAGFAEALQNFDGIIFGLCGGYQMLGQRIVDEDGWEMRAGEAEEGLGLFQTTTIFTGSKVTSNVSGSAGCAKISGYEIHSGKSTGNANPFVTIEHKDGHSVNERDGDVVEDRIYGTYIHGIFDSGEFRSVLLNRIRRKKGLPEQAARGLDQQRELELERLARTVRKHLDLERVYSLLE
ncbi:cobyric acid synthase CobQ [candidate division KSB3 bacterium]|uniref:Cobyric acid synthase n=1 Tax=candidate division KSB3 bacterium TaxID=2044937 RepID=A0A2G6EFP9_9BACT|nr:MAG: cobyric acid synthase CobQ [candidate division KSB3 bacterium]PIE31109.1 MAG: cobyric acid synthase CobQ [candidate division KSB3 bacterium]